MAENITKQVLIELNYNSEETKQQLDALKKSTTELRKENQALIEQQQKLTKAGDTSSDTYKKVTRQIQDNDIALKAQLKTQRSVELQLVNLEKANKAESQSLEQKRGALNAATAQYARYSEEAKKTDAGAIALGNNIRLLTDELKKEESALGDNRRNVGNYKQSIIEASNSLEQLIRSASASTEEINIQKKKLADLKEEYSDFKKQNESFNFGDNIQNLASQTGGLSNTFTTATSELNAFGSATGPVTSGLNNVVGSFQSIAQAPEILKQAKIAMQGFAAATGIALGPLLIIGATIAAIGVGISLFNDSVEKSIEKLAEAQKTADKLRDERNADFVAGFENIQAGYELTNTKLQNEIDLLKISGATREEIYAKERQLAVQRISQLDTLEAKVRAMGSLDIATQNSLAAKREEVNNALLVLDASFRAEELSENQKQLNAVLEQRNANNLSQLEILKDFHARKKELTQIADLDEFASREDYLNLFISDNENKLAVESEYSDRSLQLKIENLNHQRELELINAEQTGADIAAINAKYNALIAIADQQSLDGKLGMTSTVLAKTKALFKENTAAYKVLAVGQTYVDTYRAAAAALAPPPTGAGPLFGPLLAGATIASGLANIAKINSTNTGFYDGGFTGHGDPRSVSTTIGAKPYVYHKEEYVTPHQVVRDPRAQPHLMALESLRLGSRNSLTGIRGFAAGGFAPAEYSYVSASNGSNVKSQYESELSMLNLMRSLPQPIVTVEDINAGQNRVATVESRANS